MSRFKVGDNLKLVASSYPDGSRDGVFNHFEYGDEGVVVSVDLDTWDYRWSWGSPVVSVSGFNDWLVCESMLELVEDFKCHVEPDKPWPRPTSNEERTPLGLKPRNIHNQQRIQEIVTAIFRYTDASKPIPSEWIEEYNDLVNKENK